MSEGGGKLTLVLAPFTVTRRNVVNSGQKLEFVKGDLLRFDSQFVFEFALSSSLDAFNRSW